MPIQIVDIHQNNRYLHRERGFMVVSHKDQEIGRVPLEELAAVIASGHGITHSSNLLAALAERNVPFVLCNNSFQPVGMLLATDGNYHQAKRITGQLNARKTLPKRLWQTIVQSKLAMQATVLTHTGQPAAPVSSLIRKVRAGDPDNIEGQAARRYWTLLFGKDFRRDPDAEDCNTLLNYGYTIMRSATARGVIAAGLHPSIGLHHANAYDAFRLVDDLIEPFRPLIDLRVWAILQNGEYQVTPQTKAQLAEVLYIDLTQSTGTTPVVQCIYNLCTSLAQIFIGERDQLRLPETPNPLNCELIARLPDVT
jgi:CRISPR-associated protein Cas1